MKAKRLLAAVLIIVMLLSMSAFTFADNEIEPAEQNAVELEDSDIQDTLTEEVDTTSGGGDSPEAEEPVEEIEPPLEAVEEARSEIDLENVEIAEEVEAVSVSEVDDVDAVETEESSDEAIAEISEFFVGFDGAASDVVYKDGTYTATASVTPDEDEEFDAYSGTVTVVVNDGKITAVSFDGDYDEDNDTYVGYALNGRTRKGTTYASIPSQIIAANSAEGIDAVSGATCVSNAIVETVAVILSGDAAADPEPSDGYVLMNIPYAAFYAAEGVSGVDAVTTATVKTYNQTMAGGSYHSGYVTEDASTGVILGVTYPVYVADMSVLAGLTEVKAEDTATITVAAGKSALTTKEVSGADILFASGDYAYMVLDAEPANYKTLSGTAGSFSFSAVKNGAAAKTITSAALAYGGHYTDLTLSVSAEEIGDDAVVTAILLKADGKTYALRHVKEVWRKTELGWNWSDLDGSGLSGKTITNITYYTKDGGVYSYDVSVPVKLKGAEISAEFENDKSVTVTGLPADIANAKATVSSVVGRGETAVVLAENVEVKDGKIALTDAALDGTNYNVKVVSDNYADMAVQAAYTETEPESGYVLMNIPYAAFYAAEGTADVDAVTSATLNKPRTIGLAGGSYHVNADGSDITGVIYPVYVADMSLLAGYMQITDESSVTISVTNKGTTTETTFTGKEALFEAPSYAYYVLSEEPALYKTRNADGSFSAVNATASTVTGVTGEVTIGGRHTNVEIKLSGTEGVESGTQVSGVILTDADGNNYGLRHVYNIWRGTELGWNFDEYDLAGKTIKNIRYITQTAVIDYPVDIEIDEAVYVIMNIPYADFYGQIVGDANGAGIDAFTSATTKKAAYFWDSSYKGNAPVAYGEGSTIEGVQFPVLITKADLAKLSGLSSADAYYCQELSNAPKLSVKATVGEDGSVSFAKLSARATVLTDATATITTDTKHGDYMIEIADDGGILTGADNTTFQVYGAILTTAEGTYPVRHLANLYYKDFQQIALITTENETQKGQKDAAYAFYAELVGQTITSITFYTNSGIYQVNTSLLVGVEPEPESGYVLMNIPYDAFYAAEGVSSGVDAVTSATLNKPRTSTLAGGSYHVDPTGTDITGVIYPVYVTDMSVLADYTQITDESSVTISVTNRGETTETTFTGKDALFEAPSYAYYVLSEDPVLYKTLKADGSFSAVNAAAATVTGVTADVVYAGRHTNIEIPLEGTTGIEQGDAVSGVVITVSDGSKYGLRHVYNIWRATELGWNNDELDLYGKTITNIRYITQNAVIDYPVEINFKLKGTEITAAFENSDTVKVTGLPADIANAKATVSSVVGRGETAVVLAENVEVKDGKIALTDAAADGTNYNVKVVSDNYADMAVQATCTAKNEPTPTPTPTATATPNSSTNQNGGNSKTSGSSGNGPKTGDNTNIALYAVLMTVCTLALAGVVISTRRIKGKH